MGVPCECGRDSMDKRWMQQRRSSGWKLQDYYWQRKATVGDQLWWEFSWSDIWALRISIRPWLPLERLTELIISVWFPSLLGRCGLILSLKPSYYYQEENWKNSPSSWSSWLQKFVAVTRAGRTTDSHRLAALLNIWTRFTHPASLQQLCGSCLHLFLFIHQHR